MVSSRPLMYCNANPCSHHACPLCCISCKYHLLGKAIMFCIPCANRTSHICSGRRSKPTPQKVTQLKIFNLREPDITAVFKHSVERHKRSFIHPCITCKHEFFKHEFFCEDCKHWEAGANDHRI